MCTQTRIPSPSRRNESASSKSFAVSGSIVNVGSSRRSTRPSRLGSGGSCGSNSCARPSATSSPSSTFSIRSAGPSPRSTRARPRRCATTARSPGPTSPSPFVSRTIGTPGVKYGSPTSLPAPADLDDDEIAHARILTCWLARCSTVASSFGALFLAGGLAVRSRSCRPGVRAVRRPRAGTREPRARSWPVPPR